MGIPPLKDERLRNAEALVLCCMGFYGTGAYVFCTNSLTVCITFRIS